MKHRLLTILSLLLCLASIGLWMRSYWVHDSIGRVQQGRAQELHLCLGQLLYLWGPTPLSDRPWGWGQSPSSAEVIGSGSGFYWSLHPFSGPKAIGAPCWLPALISLLLPWRWLALQRRRVRRSQMGLCITCGYDLRASTERCPECGTPIPAQTATGGRNA